MHFDHLMWTFLDTCETGTVLLFLFLFCDIFFKSRNARTCDNINLKDKKTVTVSEEDIPSAPTCT